MTEFDKRGFAAVDAFFGASAEVAPPEKIQNNNDRASSKRLGLGATAKASDDGPADIHKRLLQVGKKRQRQQDNDEDETPVSEAEDDEEEAGRTAIHQNAVSRTHKRPAAILATELATAGPKKKKGKKQRALEKEEKAREKDNEGNEGEESTHKEGDGKVEKEEADDTLHEQSKTKHKRRKVRSRQKNIYKDQREKKPDHLVPANKDFNGRPLTAETRAKLNLPPSKSAQGNSETWKSSWDGDPQDTGIDAMPLAVDVEDEKPKQVTSSKKARKKKSKYKNL
jgi:hypothetical protein